MAKEELALLADLEACTDVELNAVIDRSQKLLDERDKKRKKEALERAKAIMAEAGLSFPESAGKPRGKAKAARGGV